MKQNFQHDKEENLSQIITKQRTKERIKYQQLWETEPGGGGE